MPIAKQVYRSHIFEGSIIGGANVINKTRSPFPLNGALSCSCAALSALRELPQIDLSMRRYCVSRRKSMLLQKNVRPVCDLARNCVTMAHLQLSRRPWVYAVSVRAENPLI